MIRKRKRTQGSVGATPASGPVTPGQRSVPRPLRDRPAPARVKAGLAAQPPSVPAPGVIPSGPGTEMRVRVPPVLYGRLRHYAETTGTTVEGAVAAAIGAFLQDRDY
jgi:hypothetical protein